MIWPIKKFFLNVFARFALPCIFSNDGADNDLDKLFWAACKNELTNVKIDYYSISFDAVGLQFRDIWNANKYYAWLCSGRIYKDGKLVFQWKDSRPSAYVIWKFREHLKSHNRSSIDGLLYEAAVNHKDGDA